MFLHFFIAAGLFAADATAVAPASAATIDAFVAALPPSKSETMVSDELNDIALASLEKRNPGHEKEARKVYAGLKQCQTVASQKAVIDSVRSSARRLGEEKLSRLTVFYKGADYPAFVRLTQAKPESLSTVQQAELARITKAYPLEDYAAAMRQIEQDLFGSGEFMAALFRCEEEMSTELMKQGLKP